ncbi:MAG: YeeE/YedE thiosulfate transporter family protein [Bacteroidales bacterium]|nr:YeeE/YedE thiosulfate transporter family protein [Bacteroidales bacterium]
MAPFIPQGLINPELNLFFALVLGIGFGYVLEQAGFSSSRKLAGVFYGYDFVVLRVFFTAGITAMTGLMFLSFLGWVDMSFLYINPTYVYSALLGGVIMGFGFIMGGYCPGTSFVGAVIGKVDAMVFILGSMAGIFFFGHFYDVFEPVYTGSFLGHIFVYDSLGISKAWFALILVITAILAFIFTQMIEDRVNKTGAEILKQRPSYKVPASLLIVAVFVFLLLPEERKSRINERSPKSIMELILSEEAFVSTHRVIYQLRNEQEDLILIDTRSSDEYQHFTLPGAVHMPAEDVLRRGWRSVFKNDPRRKVFFGNGNSRAMAACMTAARAGYDKVYIMDGGLNKMFEELFIDYDDSGVESYNLQERSMARFLRDARIFFLEGGLADRPSEQKPVIRAPEESEIIPVIGGC